MVGGVVVGDIVLVDGQRWHNVLDFHEKGGKSQRKCHCHVVMMVLL